MRRNRHSSGRNRCPPEVILRATEYFIKNPDLTIDQMLVRLNEEFKELKVYDEEFKGQRFGRLTRQDIYKCIREAKNTGLVTLTPQTDLDLAKEIVAEFNLAPDTVHVVPATLRNGHFVAQLAATRVAKFIRERNKTTKKAVWLGLGAGSATLDFCRHLSEKLNREPADCLLNLIALSAACPPKEAKFAPVAFFNLFPQDLVRERIGLFTEPLVKVADFPRVREQPWVRDAFAVKDKTEIIVTSMGYAMDPEDKLVQLLNQCGIDRHSLDAAGFLGNCQYRPFSCDGPIHEQQNDYRVVTLFELEDFKRFVEEKSKHIVLIVRRCDVCGTTKEQALLPLMQKFRVFSELTIDTLTATRLLALKKRSH
ncbi:MAG TPA: hypothetical protein VKV04_18965 [Verrucomicrobiae bacterium]|nr:hypothetical protein [Verrucomicrobiae bacterium]